MQTGNGWRQSNVLALRDALDKIPEPQHLSAAEGLWRMMRRNQPAKWAKLLAQSEA